MLGVVRGQVAAARSEAGRVRRGGLAVRPAISPNVGMPRLMVAARRARTSSWASFLQPTPLAGVNAQDWASDATVLVLTTGAVGPAELAEGDLAPLGR